MQLKYRTIFNRRALNKGGKFALLTHDSNGTQPPIKQLFAAMKDATVLNKVDFALLM